MLIFVRCEKDPELELPPEIITGDALIINDITAKVTFSIENTIAVKEAGIVWDTNRSLNSSSNYVAAGWVEVGRQELNLNSLTSGTTIYYRAYAKDWRSNYIYGEVKSLTTKETSSKVTTGSGLYLGYNSSLSYPYGYSFSASLVGLSEISSWGIIVSEYENLSYSKNNGIYLFEKSGYSEGTSSSMNIYWKFSSGRVRVYFRAFAVLSKGGVIYGMVKSVY